MMENQSHSEVHMMMLPPPPGTFRDREELINHVREFGVNQGYVVTIKNSKKDYRVLLGCDRGGVQRSKHNVEETKRKRKSQSRLINCPFEATGKREDDVWVLTIKNGEHNHEPIRDMSEHPCSRRFTEEEVQQIKLMTEAGLKPRQVLKALKKNNPELRSTPRHLYNVKAKIRQGNFTEKSFKSWRPTQFVSLNTSSDALTECNRQRKVRNLIGGKFVDAQATAIIDVVNPATQEVVSQVPLSSYEDFRAAVDAAKRAFPSWKRTPANTRRRIMFKFQELIHRDINKLAMRITIEQGKTLDGAKGDVLRGLEVVEQACGMASLQAGEFVSNDCNGIDTYCIREPLGVCAGICAPNFPAVISLWMFPIAITCGNTFILKPCEKSPGASMILAELALEAGLPDGVLNIIHGTNENVAHICNDDDIKAISLVGSSTAAMHIYPRAAARGKRVQSNTGARNHAIILPDASVDATLDALVAAGFGAAAQRCMALSTAIFVGGSMSWEEEIVKRAKALKLNVGTDPSADLGPVSVREEKDRICRLVQSGVESGARLILDGRSIAVPGYESGNFVGPTILCDVTTSMECYKEEMCGPVLLCMQAESIEDAITIVNRNRYESGASIFTTSDVDSRYFLNEIQAGLVGINVPVPVPLPFSSFNGSEASLAGDLNFSGKAGMQFYTHLKTVARKWKDLPRGKAPLEQPLTSENEITSRHTSLAQQPITSESDFLSSEVSPASLAPTSRVPNPGALPSVHPTTAPNLGMLLDEPSPTESQLPGPETSQSNAQAYETMHMPQSTHLNEIRDLNTSTNPASERMYLPISHPNVSSGLLSSRTETAMQSLSETMYASNGSFRSDDMNISRTGEIGFSSGGNDGTMASSSSNAYAPPPAAAAVVAQASDGVAPKSGRQVPAKTPRRFIPHQMLSMDEYQRQ